jgi:ABC-2 type transport system permease protein
MKSNSKIATIIHHEFITRVKSKGFILSTILAPILMIAMITIPVLVTMMSSEETNKKIAIVDNTTNLGKDLAKLDTTKYFLTKMAEPELQKMVLNKHLDGFVILTDEVLNAGKFNVYTSGGGGIGFISSLQNTIGDIIRRERLIKAGADESLLKLSDESIKVETKKITDKGTEKDFTAIYAGLGYFLGFFIYIMMIMYGQIVSRGVIEEKANRIIEVIASSARPFELMFGKVVGIGTVGLFQVTLWAISGFLLLQLFGLVAPSLINQNSLMGMSNNPALSTPGLAGLPFDIPKIGFGIVIAFFYYFLIGYFIYATLFAAIGSSVDQESDAAQLQGPVTIPIIIPILFIGNVISNPDGNLAIILSLIPFFSPILMIVRIAATDVPIWQIALSVVLTIGTFFACLWVASRIYRIGILMYGKKPTIKEVIKWTFIKN